jgi:agmatinase
VGVIGGDHSVPFGAIKAVAENEPSFGILHFDAHSDMRKAYEGFTWSHASIMYNVIEQIPQVTRLVQVGIRDLCEEEFETLEGLKNRIRLFSDKDLKRQEFEGISWAQSCNEIVANLPDRVWISFDIDGLDPKYCPHTGTPVPGGLGFHQVNVLFAALVSAGQKIIGFDLNEVAPDLKNPSDEWDANVGARLLYKLSAWTFLSQAKVKQHL